MIHSHSLLSGISLTITEQIEIENMNPNSTLSLDVDFDKSILFQASEWFLLKYRGWLYTSHVPLPVSIF